MRKIKRVHLLSFVGALIVAFAARTLYYYRGFYQAPEVPTSEPPDIESLSEDFSTGAEVDGMNDIVLVDIGHSNGFDEDELATLAGRLSGSGATIEYISGNLIERLRTADSLVIIAPNEAFNSDEIAALKDFTSKGGRLIVVGDPTRQEDAEAINSVSAPYGVIYQNDYIYSLEENDGNFRNVIFKDFEGNSLLTNGLESVIFQTATSIRATQGDQIILGDGDVYSSRREKPGDVIAAALAGDGQLLALPDFTFMTSPYNTFADNDILLDNIVLFALSGERSFGLTDFPYFFESQVDLVFEDPVLLNNNFAGMVDLRTALNGNNIPTELVKEMDPSSAFVYLGLYDDASETIVSLLSEDGISYSDDPLSDEAENSQGTIVIEDVAHLEKSGRVLIHVIRPVDTESEETDNNSTETDTDAEDVAEDEESEPSDITDEEGEETVPLYRLVVLAGSEEGLSTGIKLLLDGNLAQCAVTAWTAVCDTGTLDASDEPTSTPDDGSGDSGFYNILVVSDDTGLAVSGQNSAPVIDEALQFYGLSTTLHSLDSDGALSISDLAEYDMVFWSTGDYCCSAPNEESAELLMAYLDAGGRLLMDGMFIATDWDGSSFLSDYLGATFDSFGDQADIVVVDENHPLTLGLSGVISFDIGDGEVPQPDIILPDSGVDVIFERGPASDSQGGASMVAYDQNGRRVVFAAFPLYLIPQFELDVFLLNAASWLGQ